MTWKVWFKSVLPMLKYTIFLGDCFFYWRMHPVGSGFIISSTYGYKRSLIVYGTDSVKIWKTRHEISVDIRILIFTVYIYFSEIDAIVAVFVDFTDHRFERKVRLRWLDLLHHPLQLVKVDELVLVRVETAATRTRLITANYRKKDRQKVWRQIVGFYLFYLGRYWCKSTIQKLQGPRRVDPRLERRIYGSEMRKNVPRNICGTSCVFSLVWSRVPAEEKHTS